MNEQDKDVEHALDDIFNGDFIDKENKDEVVNEVKNKIEEPEKYDPFTNNSSISFKDSNNDEIENLNNKPKVDSSIYSFIHKQSDDNDNSLDIETENSEINIISNDEDNSKIETTYTNNDIHLNSHELKINESNNMDNKVTVHNKKRLIILCVILFIMILIVIFYLLLNKEKSTTCVYEADVKEYKIRDEYQITSKKNEVLYAIEYYLYEVKDDSFKEQLELIKHEKAPVVNNSNGLSGFTNFRFDYSDDYLDIGMVYDFTKFNYEEINKINQDTNPISYFKIKKNMTYDDLIKELKKNSFTCK